MNDAIIKFIDVQKNYNDFKVLTDLNFSILKGEKVVILGSSGSGKSTLVNLMNSPWKTDYSGYIYIEGNKVIPHDRISEKKRRNIIGIVLQENNLFENLTVLRNCSIALHYVHKLPWKKANKIAYKRLKEFSIEDLADKYPSQISGGQQQRVAIVRSMVMNNKILILDEPTSSLDPTMTHKVIEVIQKLNTLGITIVCVSHNIPFAKAFADKIFFIDRGLIVEQTSAKKFFSSPQTKKADDFLSKVLKY